MRNLSTGYTHRPYSEGIWEHWYWPRQDRIKQQRQRFILVQVPKKVIALLQFIWIMDGTPQDYNGE